MSKNLTVLAVGLLLLMNAQCIPSNSLQENNTIEEKVNYSNLAERLRTMGGIQVLGSGDDVDIIVRGVQSFNDDPNPIFVVDGLNMGTNYKSVNAAIDVNRIKRIRILKGKSQTAIYGEQGRNGVILISLDK